MKITIQPLERKLVAVRSLTEKGLFIRYAGYPDKCVYIESMAMGEICEYSLEKILAEDSHRTPIYEGDTVTLQF